VGEVAVGERRLALWEMCTSDAREERHREQRAGVSYARALLNDGF